MTGILYQHEVEQETFVQIADYLKIAEASIVLLNSRLRCSLQQPCRIISFIFVISAGMTSNHDSS
jgi:hypothetical protein